MNLFRNKETNWAILAIVLFYAGLGLTIYLTYNSEVITSVGSFINYYFNLIEGPFYVLWAVLIFGSFGTKILSTYIIVATRREYNQTQHKKETFNVLAILGILTLLSSEIFLFGLIALGLANFVMMFTTSVMAVGAAMVFALLVTFTPVHKYEKHLFEKGKLPIFRGENPYEYLNELDESKIKGWSILVGALFTVFTIVITVFGIIDQEILTALNTDNDLIGSLFLGSVGVITSALRAAKGSLRVL